MISIPYLIASMIIVLLPGPGSIYTISTAMNGTIKKSLIAALGCTFGIVPHLVLGIIALYMMHQLPDFIMHSIKLTGALYLVFLGFKMLTDNGKVNLSSPSIEENNIKIFLGGIFLNLLNPKLTLFFISFLPQYIVQGDISYIVQALSLGAVFMVLTLLIFICYGLLANVLRMKLLSSPTRISWMNRLFGVLFILFAVRLFI